MGKLFLFERDGEGVARTYRKTKTLAIEGQGVKIRNLAVSPTEDTLLCTLENNQMYSLNLTNTEVMKVSHAVFYAVHAVHAMQFKMQHCSMHAWACYACFHAISCGSSYIKFCNVGYAVSAYWHHACCVSAACKLFAAPTTTAPAGFIT